MRLPSRHRAIAVLALATLLGCSDDPFEPSKRLDVRFDAIAMGDQPFP